MEATHAHNIKSQYVVNSEKWLFLTTPSCRPHPQEDSTNCSTVSPHIGFRYLNARFLVCSFYYQAHSAFVLVSEMKISLQGSTVSLGVGACPAVS